MFTSGVASLYRFMSYVLPHLETKYELERNRHSNIPIYDRNVNGCFNYTLTRLFQERKGVLMGFLWHFPIKKLFYDLVSLK